ncbi:type IV secretory system conjugative DNA transfer family protein [Allonocardiopsis opalescens]|uniref:S-DNA-T family DNA segregation ATPase FtsK/SpoIIIE n=1 Tax=Allonocardiopsis opalescens TaxID=1144618 RepID=A0A2T0Q9C7_9ACTN|nr:type IV secretory system conjugative DNA transfer family protein [Allonocardiopsis opalescens]PRY00422.1 hypothetical protein CLV72_10251 [Allonocardiopsis opalescens]
MARKRDFFEGSAERAGARAASVLAPLAPPWVVAAGMVPVTAFTHHLWGGDPVITPIAASGLTLSGVVLTGMADMLYRARSVVARVHTGVTMAAGTGWFTAATIVGPTERPVLDLLMWGGATLAVSWNLRLVIRSADFDTAGWASGGFKWSDITDKIGRLKGSKLRAKRSKDGARTEGTLQLVRGEQTFDDVSSALPRLASALGTPRTGIRAVPDPERADRARLTIIHTDMLRVPTPWPGPASAGTPLSDRAPLTLGIYEDGEPVRLNPVGAHSMTVGTTGSGKSKGEWVRLADLFTRPEVTVWAIDTAKGRQTLGAALPGIDWLALTKTEATAMLKTLYTVATARADHLGRLGLEQWKPGCGINFMYVLIEEAAQLIPDLESFTKLTQVARSAGIHLCASLQRATWTNLDTDARANIGIQMCYGVRDGEDAGKVLPEPVIEAGARPEVWGANRPGYAYLCAPGIPEDRQAMPLRTYLIEGATLTQIALDYAHLRTPLDEVTAAAAGAAYAQRNRHADILADVLIRNGRAAPAPAAEQQATAAQPEPPAPTGDGELSMEVHEALQAIEPPDPEEAHLDHDSDITEPTDTITLPTPGADRPLSDEDARAAFRRQLEEWDDQGKREFRPADIRHLWVGAGKSKPWLFKQLRKLTEAGVIDHADKGVYTITPGAGRHLTNA